MPGMHTGLDLTNRVIVAAFRSALMHQGLIAVLILAALAVTWASVREWLPGLARQDARTDRLAEPPARMLMRTGFGVLWLFDGILQAQPAMPAGLPSQVLEPAAAGSPGWVQHLVSWAGSAWSFHPVQAGAAAVWIQVGIGIWLIAARGPASRLAGLVSAAWGVLVWAFGEAFGGIFSARVTWLFGAPGAVLFYCVAGLLLLGVPDRAWRSPAAGRRLLAGLGAFLAGMAVLQAWPGRGFWQGTIRGRPGTLTRMIQSMSGTPQPGVLAHWVSGFASFEAAHGFAVNFTAVLILAATGGCFLSGRPALARPGLAALAVLALTDWVLIEDLGFLGGVGTDPNSMIPMLLLASSGYLALTKVPAAVSRPPAAQPVLGGWRARIAPRRLAGSFAAARLSGIVAVWGAAVVLLGAAPMAAAQTSPTADPIIAQAIAGAAAPIEIQAPAWRLTDQHGRPVSLASLRGKVVLLTFLDPVCTTDCPLIAQEFRAADELLGTRSRQVMLVAVAANPAYYGTAYLRAFDSRERLTGLPNWLYLTGSLGQLRHVWIDYYVTVAVAPGGGMVGHNDVAFVIDGAGRIRTELNMNPGPGSAASKSSFASVLAQAVEHVLERQ